MSNLGKFLGIGVLGFLFFKTIGIEINWEMKNLIDFLPFVVLDSMFLLSFYLVFDFSYERNYKK